MKLYHQGQRSIIVDPKFVLKGGSFLPHDREKKRLYINPKNKIETTEEFGEKLIAMYPDYFMQLDQVEGKPVNRVKKSKAKAKPVKRVNVPKPLAKAKKGK